MTDERLEQTVGTLLRAGVLASAAVVLAGAAWLLAMLGDTMPAYREFRGEPHELSSAWAVIGALGHPAPKLIIQLGLLLLIATPIARVVFSLIAFALERDRAYVAITLIVLGVLLYSLMSSQ